MNALLELWFTSSVLILCLLVLRRLTRGHIPPRVMYTLWLIAALRLMLPFSLIQSPVSVMNAVEYARTEVVFTPTNFIEITDEAPESNIAEVTPPQTSAVIEAAPVKTVDFKAIAIITWIAGSVTCAVWIAAINIKLAQALKANREKVDCAGSDLPVWTVAGLASPCLFRRSIYMSPEIASDTDKIRYVIAHEYAHYRSFDPIWTALRNILLVIYWWNPLVWAAAYTSQEDCELACDESAIRALGEDERFHYGRALVGLIAQNKKGSIVSAATTMTGSSKRIKERVGLIAKKPRLFVPAFIVILAVIAVAVGCTFTGTGKKADVYERYGLSIPFPESYLGKVTATPEDVLGDNVLLELYQNATHENNPDMGWLFSITRCTEDNIISDEYIAGSTEYFATDGSWYYAIMRPTSVETDMSDESIMAEYALFQEQIETVKADFIAANKLESFSSHDRKAIDFKDYDFQGITSAVVTDGQTGESVTLHNKDDIDSITSYFKTISGSSPISSRGYYGFYYSVVLYSGNNKAFEIVFLPGNTETGYAFNYGLCETVGDFDYPFRYVLSSDMNGDFINLFGSYFPAAETGDVLNLNIYTQTQKGLISYEQLLTYSETQELITAQVNEILDSYRNGTLPNPLTDYSESEPFRVANFPKNCDIPQNIGWDDITVVTESDRSMMYPYHVLLPLDNGYNLYIDAFTASSENEKSGTLQLMNLKFYYGDMTLISDLDTYSFTEPAIHSNTYNATLDKVINERYFGLTYNIDYQNREMNNSQLKTKLLLSNGVYVTFTFDIIRKDNIESYNLSKVDEFNTAGASPYDIFIRYNGALVKPTDTLTTAQIKYIDAQLAGVEGSSETLTYEKLMQDGNVFESSATPPYIRIKYKDSLTVLFDIVIQMFVSGSDAAFSTESVHNNSEWDDFSWKIVRCTVTETELVNPQPAPPPVYTLLPSDNKH